MKRYLIPSHHHSKIRRFAASPTNGLMVFFLVVGLCSIAVAQQDPGVRGGAAGAGAAVAGLNNQQSKFFDAAKGQFVEVETVAQGLGPRFNLDSCGGCHSQPATGGSSPPVNPQIAASRRGGAQNTIPSFLSPTGPVREARFRSDGGVHDLFVISGRSDAPGCVITQPDFSPEGSLNNLSFRIPTPTFGLGKVENTSDQSLIDDTAALADRRSALGVAGRFNHSGNDGTITRFGWKAQNKSLEIFAGEAYNVEMGVTNELFPNEREGEPDCQFNPTPESDHNIDVNGQASASASDVTLFATFMKLLEVPTPAPATTSTTRGQQAFNAVGCDLCHTSKHTTGPSQFSGLSNTTFFPYSDFQLHDMGVGLQDGIAQGDATGREFRTAPLWGVGQRVFFLHDGRTKDLMMAVQAHASSGSEANLVIDNFNALTVTQKQDILNFLRGL